MRPFRLFISGMALLTVFILLAIITPGNHKIASRFTLKIPALFSSKTPGSQYKDISKIINLSQRLVNDSVIENSSPTNSTSPAANSLNTTKSPLNTDSIRNIIRPLEYPAGNDTVLFPAFANLQKITRNHHLIRILHYGDSQIEGDRITSYLRNQLQDRFGGCGIGMFPIVPSNPGSISYNYSISDNWKKFTTLVPLPNSTGKFGPLLSYARINDAKRSKKITEHEAWINLKYANVRYPAAQHFDQCRLFYGFNKSAMTIDLKQNNDLLQQQIVQPSTNLQVITWNFPQSSKNITITIKTTDSPDIFGIALDGESGVAVDNIPLRGSSGLEFSKTDLAFLKNFYYRLNVKLIILQFGVNMVPYVTNHFDYYEKSFLHQLLLIKEYLPNLPVIVLGVSDVSQNGSNGYETYPNVTAIRDIQKRATLEAGFAFWDLYEAMGGKNSMPSWVFASPPLAQKDFTHFNPVGAKLIGEMFYTALITEYNRYCKLKSNTIQ